MFSKIDEKFSLILKTILVIIGLFLAWVIRDIILVVLLAFVLASAMEPLVDYLKVKRVPRSLTVFLVYSIVLGVIAFIFSLIVPLVIDQTKVLAENLPTYISEFQNKYPFVHNIVNSDDLSGTLQLFSLGGDTIFLQTYNFFNLLFYVFTILVISFYLVAEEQGMKKFISTFVPATSRMQVTAVVVKIQKKMGMWVLGQFILGLTIFSMTYIALTLLGVEYALFLALLAGLFEVIPYIGPTISAVPAIFFAFLQNPALALAVGFAYLLIQKVEGLVLVPKVMEKAVGLSPLAVLLALMIGFKVAGVVGLLLAVPLLGIANVLIEEVKSKN